MRASRAEAVRRVFASLYNDRAIAYRAHHGFAHETVALSAGVQRMVRSDVGTSGVLFTLDTESGFPEVVLITSAYGLGELVVQGAVNPDQRLCVYKPNLRAGRPAVIRRHLGDKAKKMVLAVERRAYAVVAVPPEDRGRYSLPDPEAERSHATRSLSKRHYGRPWTSMGRDGTDGAVYPPGPTQT